MDYKNLENYWIEKEKGTEKMPEKKLLSEIYDFISKRNTLALATSDLEGHVRNTPVEYIWMKDSIYILTEGGKKFRGLSVNPNVSVTIFDNYSGFNDIHSVQISGTVDFIELWSDEYNEVLTFHKLPVDKMKEYKTTLILIKIIPNEINFLDSSLKEKGFFNRQNVYFDN